MIKEFRSGKNVIALLIDASDAEDETRPLTHPSWPLQALMIKRLKGHVFAKHAHKDIPRASTSLQEAIVVQKGKLAITICERNGTDVADVEVRAGQVLFLVNGGYRVEVVEDVLFYEFKNGPHVDDKVMLGD